MALITLKNRRKNRGKNKKQQKKQILKNWFNVDLTSSLRNDESTVSAFSNFPVVDYDVSSFAQIIWYEFTSM